MRYRVKHDRGFIDEPDIAKASALAVRLNGTIEFIEDEPAPTQTFEEAWALGLAHVNKYFTPDQRESMLKIVASGEDGASLLDVQAWFDWAKTKLGAKPILSKWEKAMAVKVWIDNMEKAAVEDAANFNPGNFGEPPYSFRQIMGVEG